MKKWISLFLIFAMTISFVGCGSKDEKVLTSTRWVDIYKNTIISFDKDGSLEVGNNKGTWVKDSEGLTLEYTVESNGNTIELKAEVFEEDGETFIKTKRGGKKNGDASSFDVFVLYPEEIVDAKKSEISKKLGETVSTDIVGVTIKKAALAYYANAAMTSTSNGKTTNIDTACEPSDGGYFESSKGRCLLCIDFEIDNKDRDTINTDDNIISFSVNQNEKSAIVYGYDINDKDGRYGFNLNHIPISINGGDFKTNNTINALIFSNTKAEIKYVGVVGFEPEDISSSFDVVVNIKNSNDEVESFIFNVN